MCGGPAVPRAALRPDHHPTMPLDEFHRDADECAAIETQSYSAMARAGTPGRLPHTSNIVCIISARDSPSRNDACQEQGAGNARSCSSCMPKWLVDSAAPRRNSWTRVAAGVQRTPRIIGAQTRINAFPKVLQAFGPSLRGSSFL